METEKEARPLCNCLRCGYSWHSTTKRIGGPKNCAKCASPYWMKPRIRPQRAARVHPVEEEKTPVQINDAPEEKA